MEINISITNILKISLCYSFLMDYFISNSRYYNNHNIIANEYIINSEYSNLIYNLSKKYNP